MQVKLKNAEYSADSKQMQVVDKKLRFIWSNLKQSLPHEAEQY